MQGGCSSEWGVCSKQEKNKDSWAEMKAENVLGLELGRFRKKTGRVRRGYIRVLRPIFFHFSKSFSLFPSQTLGSLSSLSSLTHLLRREGTAVGDDGGVVASRLRRRRRRPKCLFFKIFCSFPMYFSLLIPFSTSKFQKK